MPDEKEPSVTVSGREPTELAGVDFAAIKDVSVTFTMRLGRTTAMLKDVLELGDQSLIELDRLVSEPIDVLVNGRLFARGEVVTVNENFGVKIIQIFHPEGSEEQ